MVSTRALSNPQIVINNQVVQYVPNSVSFKEGKGEYKLRPHTSGGQQVSNVLTQDLSTRKSMLKLKFLPTTENIEYASQWKGNLNRNSILITEEDFTRTINNAAITNDYEVAIGADAEFELSFEGDTAI